MSFKLYTHMHLCAQPYRSGADDSGSAVSWIPPWFLPGSCVGVCFVWVYRWTETDAAPLLLSLYSNAFEEMRCPSGRKGRRKWPPLLLLLLLRDWFSYFSARRTRDTCCVSIDGQVQLSPRRTSRGAARQALLKLFSFLLLLGHFLK